jgi:hypothetical protein
MKSNFLVCLALVLSGILSGCSSHPDTLHYWQAKAAQVTIGMTRGQVEKILPTWSASKGQLARPEVSMPTGGGVVWMYWVSEDCRVTIKYDSNGGEGSISNRVISPVKLEKHEYDLKTIDGVKFQGP